MENNDQKIPSFKNEGFINKDKKNDGNGDLNADENLVYNEKDGSYEFDVNSDDPDYQHDDPYDTAVEQGGDADSDYDEANPMAVHEYDKDAGLEKDIDSLGMHIDHGQSVRLSKKDEKLAETPEDSRDDLDEEGYPKNDRK